MLTRSTEMPATMASHRQSGWKVGRAMPETTATASSREIMAAISSGDSPSRGPSVRMVWSCTGCAPASSRDRVA